MVSEKSRWSATERIKRECKRSGKRQVERKRATVNRYVCQERGEVFFPVDEESNLDRGETAGGCENERVPAVDFRFLFSNE